MFWVRGLKTLDELKYDDTIKNTKTYLFKLENSVGCYITRYETYEKNEVQIEGPYLICETADAAQGTLDIQVDLAEPPDIQSWMHVTYSAQYNPSSTGLQSKSYLRIDISSFNKVWEGGYKPIQSNKVYYGAGGTDVTMVGFPGHYRQFWITVGYIEQDRVPLLSHEYKVLDYSTMAYYRFEKSIYVDRFDDSFRQQTARPLGLLPAFIQENIAAPYCNSIPPKEVFVPQFYQASKNKFSNQRIPRFSYIERDFGYTVSFWMKNMGAHASEPNPKIGREQNHIFSLDECFALWYDSETSFRVYVYAKTNIFETFSDPVFMPLYEWINIQVAISKTTGITVMVFNQNGERQQIVQKKIFLSEQYPKGTISYFQSFIGVAYKLFLWEQYIQLPVDPKNEQQYEKYQASLIVAHDFTNYIDGTTETGFEGWPTLVRDNGENLPATLGSGFDFFKDNVPSAANFENPVLNGQLQAASTEWDVTCPAPTSNRMYIAGEGSKFDISILIEKTETYTVEFWFKANVTEFAAVSQDRTYLFMLNGRLDGIAEQQLTTYTINIMAIYVENNELKCAPFGFTRDGQVRDEETVLTYSGVNPLNETEWQHITCIFLRQKYVKGQYLAVSLDEEGADLSKSDFIRKTYSAQTFSKTVYRSKLSEEILIQNYEVAQRWTMILGNAPDLSKSFFGTFKDVRIWKQSRSDAELFSYRFNQAEIQDNLEGNIKFMDGSFDVYNAADTNTNGPRYPKNEPSMNLLPTDLTNIICASDTYFNYDLQKCTRYPYTANPSIVYMVTNNVQHGHQIIIERMFESTMKLPGEKFQPSTKTEWFVNSSESVDQKYFQNRGLNRYNLDPIFMGDYKPYRFRIEMNDIVNHNFFLFMDQTIIPRKCLQVVDVETKENKRNIRVLLDQNEQKPLEVKFQVNRIDGCADEYQNTLEKQLKIETQPPIPESIVKEFKQTFDEDTKMFTIAISERVLEQMPLNLPINIIFYLFWSSNDPKLEDNISYMNVVYTLTLAQKIDVRLDYGGKNVIDISEGQDLKINAICSSFYDKTVTDCTEASGSTGLSFKWECATGGNYTDNDIRNYCQQWNGSPVIVIPNSKISENNAINKAIRIRAVVSSIEASEQTGEAATDLQFRSALDESIFTWVNRLKPKFTIRYPQKSEDGEATVLVTKQQEILILPEGWKLTDGYKISYSITNAENGELIQEEDECKLIGNYGEKYFKRQEKIFAYPLDTVVYYTT